MSSPLAIGAVTAVMRDIINNVAIPFVPSTLGTVTVSALAPALILHPESDTRINLFLYHVTLNPGWRNRDLPSRDPRGDRATNPLLALDLHYLLTAYGKNDYEAEILLGASMHAFHEVPVLTREQIRKVFNAVAPPPIITALKGAHLADQVEMLKIAPVPLTTEESSKLWSSLLTAYRPSVAYQVSVVLIESTRPAKSPLPVLRRGESDAGVQVQSSLVPPYPTITSIDLPTGRQDVRLGESITIHGLHLAGNDIHVRFDTPHIEPPTLEATIVTHDDTTIEAKLPNAPTAWPAGPYAVSVILRSPTAPEQQTNEMPVLVAPSIARRPTTPPATELDINVTAVSGGRRLSVKSAQDVWPRQRVLLIVGQRQIAGDERPATGTTSNLTFTIMPASALPTGRQLIRLRVDGVDSRVLDPAVTPPQFDPGKTMVIPP